jgi:hypothetical protein
VSGVGNPLNVVVRGVDKGVLTMAKAREEDMITSKLAALHRHDFFYA